MSIPSCGFRQAVETTARDVQVDVPPLLNQAPCGITAFLFQRGARPMSSHTRTRRLTRLAVCLLLCSLAAVAGAEQPQDKGKKTAGRIERRTYDFKEAGKA